MADSEVWIKDEILEMFFETVDDYKAGVISEGIFKERLFRIAERYERTLRRQPAASQKKLFSED